MQGSITREYIEQNRTQGSGYNFKVRCPDCGGSNLYVTMGNGFGYCFNCASSYWVEGVEARQRKQKELKTDITQLREVYKTAACIYAEQLTGDHIRYLEGRGIDEYTRYEFQIGFCTGQEPFHYTAQEWMDSGLSDYRGRPSMVGRMTFPYVSMDGYTDLRGRSNEEDPKYKSPLNPSACRGAFFPFNWTTKTLERARKHKRIIITEGEFKAIAAHQCGFAAVGLPGIMSWKNGFIPDSDWTVVAIFDSMRHPERRLDTDRALARLSSKIPNLSVTTLPLFDEDKMDIDSFITHRRGGKSYFEELVYGAIDYKRYAQLRRF